MGTMRGPCAGASRIGTSLRAMRGELATLYPSEIERDTADRLKVGNPADSPRARVRALVGVGWLGRPPSSGGAVARGADSSARDEEHGLISYSRTHWTLLLGLAR